MSETTRDQVDGAHCRNCSDVHCPGDQAAGNALSREREKKRELSRIKSHLRDLIRANRLALAGLDVEMKKPSDVGRGRRIAQISNAIDMATDSADHTGLGRSFAAIRRDKNQAARSAD